MTSSPTARRVVPAEHRAPRGALPALAVDLLLTVLFVALGQGSTPRSAGCWVCWSRRRRSSRASCS
ncbi:hypothetical protein [Micrococcus luteus]|uniref:hypothetical protein n=1 Tax=Micrococcus luteus TaxID=1270 RepID=UPI0021CC71D3|nr:hypothetical protein [Micrococcus luteus]